MFTITTHNNLQEHGRQMLDSLRANRGLSAADIDTLPVIHAFANRMAIRFLWMYGGTIAITVAGAVGAEWIFGLTEPAVIGLVAVWGAVVFFWLTSTGHDCYYRLILCELSCRQCGKRFCDVEKLAKSRQCPHCNTQVQQALAGIKSSESGN